MEKEINKSALTTAKNKPLLIVLIVMVMLFLMLSGGALSVTIENGGLMGSGWSAGISWMWIPALLFLSLSALLAWTIFIKKKV